jgi:hypothetical protein
VLLTKKQFKSIVEQLDSTTVLTNPNRHIRRTTYLFGGSLRNFMYFDGQTAFSSQQSERSGQLSEPRAATFPVLASYCVLPADS